VLATYDAFVDGELDRIPEFFHPEGVYRASGVFPGIEDSYRGHARIEEFWHAANEPWESFEIEALRTVAEDDWVAAEVQFRGRGLGSGVEVTIDAGHLIRFRDALIIDFSAYASWGAALAAAEHETR
jgi:ketosteroid isomerase-like protein